jgi:metallo-beta-lactamase family protein
VNEPYNGFKGDIDCFVLEATYGSHKHMPISDSLECLKDSINTVHKSGGRLIIPAFSIMRSQMMLYYLFKLYQKELVPKLPIFYASPSAMDVNHTMYCARDEFNQTTLDDFLDPDNNPFNFDQLHYMRNKSDNDSLFTKQGSYIVIASSGMCDVGRIQGHLRYSLENPKNLVFLPGWQSPDKLGSMIMGKAKNPGDSPTISIWGNKIKVQAMVRSADFSNHTDNIAEHVNRIMPPSNPPKLILIKHGEQDGCEGVRDQLTDMGYPPEIIKIMDKGVSYYLQ